jgi:hypothetical protein
MQNLLYLERVVGSTVVQIMAEACNQQSQTFNLTKYFPPLGNLKWMSIITTVYWLTSQECCQHYNLECCKSDPVSGGWNKTDIIFFNIGTCKKQKDANIMATYKCICIHYCQQNRHFLSDMLYIWQSVHVAWSLYLFHCHFWHYMPAE